MLSAIAPVDGVLEGAVGVDGGVVPVPVSPFVGVLVSSSVSGTVGAVGLPIAAAPASVAAEAASPSSEVSVVPEVDAPRAC